MAESEDHLFRFLLDKIAHGGNAGCTADEILSHIEAFHSTNAVQDAPYLTQEANALPTVVLGRTSVDRIWRRLSRHPNVSIGQDRAFNHLSWSDIESRLLSDKSAAVVQTDAFQLSRQTAVAAQSDDLVAGIPEPRYGTEPLGTSQPLSTGTWKSLRFFFIKTPGPEATSNEPRPIDLGSVTYEALSPAKERESSLHATSAYPRRRVGPRKFVEGTQQFWRDQFFIETGGRATALKDPANAALFADRPSRFDEVLVQAIKNHLPIPAAPQEIRSEWVERTLWILNRSSKGVYISTRGEQPNGVSKFRPTSQVLILRSSRLREIDFSEHRPTTAVRFVTSSVAHTLRRQGFFSIRHSSIKSPFGPSPPVTLVRESEEEAQSVLVDKPSGSGLDTAVSHLDSEFGTRHVRPSLGRQKRKSEGSEEIPGKILQRPRDNSQGDGSRSRPAMLSLEETELTKEAATTRPVAPRPLFSTSRELPQPLTTRSRRRHLNGQDISAAPAGEHQALVPSDDAQQPRDSEFVPTDVTTDNTPPQKQDKRRAASKTKPLRKTSEAGESNASALFRKIVLETVEDCGGMVPNNFNSISDYLVTKWRKAGRSGYPDRPRTLAAIKSLCDCGKLRRLYFSYRSKGGTMPQKSLLVNPEVDATSQVVKSLQDKVIEALPLDYVPPLASENLASTTQSLVGTDRLLQTGFPAVTASEKISVNRHNSQIKHCRVNPGARRDRIYQTAARNPFRLRLSRQGDDVSIPSVLLEQQVPFYYFQGRFGQPGDPEEAFKEESKPSRKSVGKSQYTKPRQGSKLRSMTKGIEDEGDVHPLDEHVDQPQRFGRSSRGRKIIWKKREDHLQQPLPSSLREILDQPQRMLTADHAAATDSEWSRFEWEVDAVQFWELQSFNLFQQQNADWHFINHIMQERYFPALEQEKGIQFQSPYIADVQEAPVPQQKSNMLGRKQALRAPKLPAAVYEDENIDSDYDPTATRTRGKRKRRSSFLDTTPRKRARRKVQETPKPDKSKIPGRKSRGTQYLRLMSDEDIYRMTVAVVVVRTLAGGVEKRIDWSIVMQLFAEHEERFVKERWKTLSTRYRSDIESLTESLQRKYLEAYERDDVPRVDFSNPYNSDWEGILAWAVKNLDRSGLGDEEELPGTREELLRTKSFAFEDFPGLRNVLGYNVNTSNVIKEELLSSTVFASELAPTDKYAGGPEKLHTLVDGEEPDYKLARAKSWALSVILTPRDKFDTESASAKLSSLAASTTETENLFDSALKELQRDKVIKRNMAKSKGSGVTEGGWQASEKWLETFGARRMITAAMLRQASAYKREVLDVQFAQGARVEIAKDRIMEDGEMVAILNLAANGRLRIRPGQAGFPHSRYGLDSAEKGYSTRLMDKSVLAFGVALEPVEGWYEFGGPSGVPVPPWEDGGEGRIPAWIDIHGALLEDMWQMFVGAVIGLVSGRPGIGPAEIVLTLARGLALWEIETILAWLEGSGFAKRTSHGAGWETEEWWWMVCGP